MPPKFGNYLFRNLKSNGPASSPENAGPGPADLAAVEEQEVVLRPEDFGNESAGALNWAVVEPREVRVKLKETHGLMEGRVTLPAKVLRERYPGLVAGQLQEDVVFSLSLRSVVLQLQHIIGSPANASPAPGGPDFDTPIAQVAREDEGFFNLEQDSRQSAAGGAPESPDASPVFPLIREKPEPRAEAKEIPPLPVLAQPCSLPPEPARAADDAPKREPSPVKKVRQQGMERLQELFLTDDPLDAAAVARLLMAFPKVKGVSILLEDGSVLGGELPANYNFASVASAPALMQAVRRFGAALTRTEVAAFTLAADMPVSIFLEGRVCLVIAHEGRGLLPGMRDRFTDIARALDELYQ